MRLNVGLKPIDVKIDIYRVGIDIVPFYLKYKLSFLEVYL